jgi:hypothetical protein
MSHSSLNQTQEVADMGRRRNGFGALSEPTGVKRTVDRIFGPSESYFLRLSCMFFLNICIYLCWKNNIYDNHQKQFQQIQAQQ